MCIYIWSKYPTLGHVCIYIYVNQQMVVDYIIVALKKTINDVYQWNIKWKNHWMCAILTNNLTAVPSGKDFTRWCPVRNR